MTQIPHGYAAFYSHPAYGQPVSNNNTVHQDQAPNGAQLQWQQPYTGGTHENVNISNQ
jgi:hypothetical protein